MRRKHSTGRDLTMLFGGIAAGIAGSRVLPPLIAMLSGSGRVHAGQDPFDRLIDDHRQIRSVLDEMVAAPADSRFKRSRMFLKLKRKLAKHALAEEDVVYPLLHDEPDQAGQSKHLYDEHADMKILLFQLEELLMAGRDWSEPARSLRELVVRHVELEEQTVFPRLRHALSESRQPKVSGQIRREEALIL